MFFNIRKNDVSFAVQWQCFKYLIYTLKKWGHLSLDLKWEMGKSGVEVHCAIYRL
jgi:hypothetical protein